MNTPTEPRFARPPVVEIAMAIQFDELKTMKGVHFGLFFDSLRNRFPLAEEQQRVPIVVESFPRTARQFGIRLQSVPEVARVLFKDSTEAVGLQIQPDRFGYNWRRMPSDREYRPFSDNLDCCMEDFRGFTEFCGKEQLGEISPQLFEVVYVNHIHPTAGEDVMELFSKVFFGLEWRHSDNWLPRPENAAFNRVYEIGNQRGRLYTEASIATDQKAKGDYVLLKMTGRVIANDGLSAVRDSLQLAHDWVVNGFVSITNPEFRVDRWGQQL